MSATEKQLLAPPITGDYLPSAHGVNWQYTTRFNKPQFHLFRVSEMLMDPTVCFSLYMLKGPLLSNARFFIDCDNPEAKDYIVKNVSRFWKTSAARALKAMEWGYSGHEILYRVEEGKVHFDVLKDLHPLDCKPVTDNGKLVGMTVSRMQGERGKPTRVFVGGQRCLWHIHQREIHPWFGRSRLFGAFLPWNELWTDGGFRDARTLFYRKYAYTGGAMYHPPGNYVDQNGQYIPNKDLAREILEKLRNGGVLTLPNETDEKGQRKWEWIRPEVLSVPQGIHEYGDALKREIQEGMGLPSEVGQAEGTGAFAGRRIPQQALYASLQEVVQWLMFDFDQQSLRALVEMYYPGVSYEIMPLNLLRSDQEQNAVDAGEPNDPFQNTPQNGTPPGGARLSQRLDATRIAERYYIANGPEGEKRRPFPVAVSSNGHHANGEGTYQLSHTRPSTKRRNAQDSRHTRDTTHPNPRLPLLTVLDTTASSGRRPLEEINNLFVYGTLLDGPLRQFLLDQDPPTTQAFLPFSRIQLVNSPRHALTLVPEPSGVVPGLLLQVTKQQMQHLDRWEQGYVRVLRRLTGGKEAWVFIRKEKSRHDADKRT